MSGGCSPAWSKRWNHLPLPVTGMLLLHQLPLDELGIEPVFPLPILGMLLPHQPSWNVPGIESILLGMPPHHQPPQDEPGTEPLFPPLGPEMWLLWVMSSMSALWLEAGGFVIQTQGRSSHNQVHRPLPRIPGDGDLPKVLHPHLARYQLFLRAVAVVSPHLEVTGATLLLLTLHDNNLRSRSPSSLYPKKSSSFH